MKRFSIFLLMLLLSVSAWSVRYQSNCLGQKIGNSETPIDETGWVIEEEGDVLVLSFNGEPKKKFWTNITEDSTVTTVQNLEDGSIVKTFFKDGFPNKIINVYDEYTTVTTFQFADGNLSSTICEKDGAVLWAEYYRRDPGDDSLVSVSRYDSQNLLGKNFVWDNGNLVNIISSDFAVNDDFSVSEEGNVVIEKDGITTIYNPQGQPVSQTSQDTSTTWEYENALLISKTTVKGSEKSIDSYEDGILTLNVTYDAGVKVSETKYNPDGMVRTVWAEGKPIARVYYMPDNRHIQRIVYL